MRLFIACLAALALLSAPAARACPPAVDPNGGGSFSYGGGYGADMCEAPMAVAGNFGGGSYGSGAMFAAPSYSASFAAPVYSAPVVQRQVFAAPSYGYGASFAAPVRVRSFGMPAYGVGRRFGGGFRGGYSSVNFAAPVIHTQSFAAPVYGASFAAPASVITVPVRAPGPIRGALQGFRAGLRNRLSGF